jgi:hypothetical protein
LGAAVPVLPFLLWSCNSYPLQKPIPNPVGELAQYREINPIHKVDIVFVVDNSGSMSQEQGNLTRNFQTFMNELNVPGADLQIAVVSSDLGGGAGSAQTGCNTGGGDKGVFCTTRSGGQGGGMQVDKCAQCAVDTSGGRFLRTVNPNFQGTIANTFTCMATLGTNGCGFEHSIGALVKSLTAPENGAFVRDDAYLAFVVITDEDDCSAPADSDLFSAAVPGQDWSLRCALEAHTCGGAHNDGTMNVDRGLSECQAASDGKLVALKELQEQVLNVKNDPDQIIAAGIFGWPLPNQEPNARYQIRGPNNNGGGGDRGMRPICESRNGEATPAFRVKSFVESFPNHSTYSICQDEFSEAMRRIGEKIKVVLGSPCIDAMLVDAKPETRDLDPDCAVVERRPRGGGDYEEVILSRCQAGDTKPCWQINPDQTCSVSKYNLQIDRKGEAVVEGTTQSIRCLTVASK